MTNRKQSEPRQAGLWSAKARAINENLAARTPTIHREPARSATFPSSRAGQRKSFRRRAIQKPRLLYQHHAGPVCIFRNVCKLLRHHLGGSSLTLRQSEKLPMQHAIAYEATKKAAEGTF
ncbi:hypothetical protein X797_008929 [Metarhizium robertsii]|uniref:Uncharacterized protein n=1 Tax=Metarhizium robertsii TaxID=568076 RepID=A0A014P675_9HYPO|nr:hypothetical protein X797_008929 [Metarhizium robertsii]